MSTLSAVTWTGSNGQPVREHLTRNGLLTLCGYSIKGAGHEPCPNYPENVKCRMCAAMALDNTRIPAPLLEWPAAIQKRIGNGAQDAS